MPSETGPTQQSSTTWPTDWLIPYREAFLAELEGLGYAPGSIRHFQDAIDLFREQVASRGLGPGDIDAPCLAELQDAVPKPQSLNASRCRRSCLTRFIDHLVTAGVIVAPEAEPLPPPGVIGLIHLRLFVSGDRCRKGLRRCSNSAALCADQSLGAFSDGPVH